MVNWYNWITEKKEKIDFQKLASTQAWFASYGLCISQEMAAITQCSEILLFDLDDIIF